MKNEKISVVYESISDLFVWLVSHLDNQYSFLLIDVVFDSQNRLIFNSLEKVFIQFLIPIKKIRRKIPRAKRKESKRKVRQSSVKSSL